MPAFNHLPEVADPIKEFRPFEEQVRADLEPLENLLLHIESITDFSDEVHAQRQRQRWHQQQWRERQRNAHWGAGTGCVLRRGCSGSSG